MRDLIERSIYLPPASHDKETEGKSKRSRLFVDMDGTLAEWQTLQVDSEEELYNILTSEGYFKNLQPYKNVVNAIRWLCKHSNLDVYIASAYMEGCPALKDKNLWLDEYLPQIPVSNRIFIPYGKSKADFVPGGIRGKDILLDDYNKNLNEWPGMPVKLVNPVNHTKGTWQGARIGYLAEASEIEDVLIALAQ